MVCYDIHIFNIEALFKADVIHMPHLYILKGNASQMEPLHSICKSYVMGFFVSKNKSGFNIVST